MSARTIDWEHLPQVAEFWDVMQEPIAFVGPPKRTWCVVKETRRPVLSLDAPGPDTVPWEYVTCHLVGRRVYVNERGRVEARYIYSPDRNREVHGYWCTVCEALVWKAERGCGCACNHFVSWSPAEQPRQWMRIHAHEQCSLRKLPLRRDHDGAIVLGYETEPHSETHVWPDFGAQLDASYARETMLLRRVDPATGQLEPREEVSGARLRAALAARPPSPRLPARPSGGRTFGARGTADAEHAAMLARSKGEPLPEWARWRLESATEALLERAWPGRQAEEEEEAAKSLRGVEEQKEEDDALEGLVSLGSITFKASGVIVHSSDQNADRWVED